MKWKKSIERIAKYAIVWIVLPMVWGLPARAEEIVWERINEPDGNIIHALLATPDGTVYALTQKNGVFRLEKGTGSWIPINTGLSGTVVTTLVASSEGIVYAGTRYHGVFSLREGEDVWVPAGLAGLYVTGLAVSGEKLYAGVDGIGVYRSDDGRNWTDTHFADLDFPDTRKQVKRVGASETVVCASHFAGHASVCVLCSQDSGKTWMRTDCLAVLSFAALNHALYTGTEYLDEFFWGGGVYRLSETEVGWAFTGLGKMSISALAASDSMLYAGTRGQGVFRFDDEGNTWLHIGLADGNTTVYALAVTETTLYAGTNRGAFRASLADKPTAVHLAGKSAVTWGLLKGMHAR